MSAFEPVFGHRGGDLYLNNAPLAVTAAEELHGYMVDFYCALKNAGAQHEAAMIAIRHDALRRVMNERAIWVQTSGDIGSRP